MQTAHLTRSAPTTTMMSSSVRPPPADVSAARCSCCPYGYHIDVDFLGFLDSLKNGGDLRRLKKIHSRRREQRQLIETRMLIEGQQLNVDADERGSSSDFGSGPVTPVSQSSEDEREEEGSTTKMLEEIDASIADALISIDVLMHSRKRPPVNVSSYDNVSIQSTTNGDISQHSSTSLGKSPASFNISAALPFREISPAASSSGSSSSSQQHSNSVSPVAGVTYVEPYQQARVAVTVRNTESGRRSLDAVEKRYVATMKSPPPIPQVRSSSTKYSALQTVEKAHNAKFIDPEFPTPTPVLTSVSHHTKHSLQLEKCQRTSTVNSRSPEVSNISSTNTHTAHKMHVTQPMKSSPEEHILPQTSAVTNAAVSSSRAVGSDQEIFRRIPEKQLSDSGSEVENEVKVTAGFSSPTGRITNDSRGQEMLMRILVEKSTSEKEKPESLIESSVVNTVTKSTTTPSVNNEETLYKQPTPSSDFGRSARTTVLNTRNFFQSTPETSKTESGAVVKEKHLPALQDAAPQTMFRQLAERSFSDSGVEHESADSSIGDQPTSPVDGSLKSEEFSTQRQRPASDSDATGTTCLRSNDSVAVGRSLPARPSSASDVESSTKMSSSISAGGRAAGGLRVVEQETFQQRLHKSQTDSPAGRASPKSSSFSSVRALQNRKQPSRRVTDVASPIQTSTAVSMQANGSEKLGDMQPKSTVHLEAGSRQPTGSGLQDGSQTQGLKFLANAHVGSKPQGAFQLETGSQDQAAARLSTSTSAAVTTVSSGFQSTNHGPSLRHFSPPPFQRKESQKEPRPSIEPHSMKDKPQTGTAATKSVSETDISIKQHLLSKMAVPHFPPAENISPIEDLISDSSVMTSKLAEVQSKSADNIPYETVSMPLRENKSQSTSLEVTPTDSKNVEISQKKKKEKDVASDETLQPCAETSSEQLAKAMAFLMTDSDYITASPGSPATGQVDPDVLMSIRQYIASSLQQMRLLEQQAKTIPVLQLRISVLKEEKRLMRMQLASLKKSGMASVPTMEKCDEEVIAKPSNLEENEFRKQLDEMKKIMQCSIAVGDCKISDELENELLCKNCRLAINGQDIPLTDTPIQHSETRKCVASQSTELGTIWTPHGKSPVDGVKSPSEEGVLYPQPSSPPRGRACRVIVEDSDQTLPASGSGKGSSSPSRRQPPPVARKEISIRREGSEDRCSVGIQCMLFQSNFAPVSSSKAPVSRSESGQPADINIPPVRSQEPDLLVAHCLQESFPIEPRLQASYEVDVETALLTAKIQTSSTSVNTDLCGIDRVLTFSAPGTVEHLAKSNDLSDVSQSAASLVANEVAAADHRTLHHINVNDCSINTDISGEIFSARFTTSELQPIPNDQTSVHLWRQPTVMPSIDVQQVATEAIDSHLLSPKPLMINASCSADLHRTQQLTDMTMKHGETDVKTKPEMTDAGCSTDLLMLPTLEWSDVVDANRAASVHFKAPATCDAAVNTTDCWNFEVHDMATGSGDGLEKSTVILRELDISATQKMRHEVSCGSDVATAISYNENICMMCKHAVMKRSVAEASCNTETVTAASEELPITGGQHCSSEAVKSVTVSESFRKYLSCDASCNTDPVAVLSAADSDVAVSRGFSCVSTCERSCNTDAALSLPSPPAATKKKPPVKLPTKDFGCTAKIEVAEAAAKNKSEPKLPTKNVECSADIKCISHDVACCTDQTKHLAERGCNTDEAVKASFRDAASAADIPRKISTCTVAINTVDILKLLVVDVGCGTENVSRLEMCEICCGPDDPFDILKLQELASAANKSLNEKSTFEVACNTDTEVKLVTLDQSSTTDKPSRADSHTTMHSCTDTSTVASNTDTATVKNETTETQNYWLTTTEVGSNTDARPPVREAASLTDVIKLVTSEVGCCTDSVSKPLVRHASSTADIRLTISTCETASGADTAFSTCDVLSATDVVVMCESQCNTDVASETEASKDSVPVSSSDVGCSTDIICRPSVVDAATSTDVASTSSVACITDLVNFVESSTKDEVKLISTAEVACETDLISVETSAVSADETLLKTSCRPVTCETACNTEVSALELNSSEKPAVCDVGCMTTNLETSTSNAACSVDIIIKPSMRDVSCDANIAIKVSTSDAAVTAATTLQEFGCNTDAPDKQISSIGCTAKPSMADSCCTTESTVSKDADSMTELVAKSAAVDVSSNTDEVLKPATMEVSCSAELKVSAPSSAVGCNTDPVARPVTDTVASNTDPLPQPITHAVACNTDDILKPSTKTVGCSVEQKVLIPTIESGSNTDKPLASDIASNTDPVPMPETQAVACNTDEILKPATRTVGLLTEVKVLTPTLEFGCSVDLISKPSTSTVSLNTDPLKDADIIKPLTWEVACNTDLPRETVTASSSEAELNSPSPANRDIISGSLVSEHVCSQPPKPVMVEVSSNTDLSVEPGTLNEWVSVAEKESLVDMSLKVPAKVPTVDVACNTDLLRDSGSQPLQKKEMKEVGCIASPTTRESSSLTDTVDVTGDGVLTSPATTPVKSSGKSSSKDKTTRRIFAFESSTTVEENISIKTPDKLPSMDLVEQQVNVGTADVACGTDIELHSKIFSMGFDQDQLATMLAALDSTDERTVAIRRRFYPTQDAACNTDHDLKQVTPTRQLGKPAFTPFSPTSDDVAYRSEAVSVTPHDDIVVGPSEILRESASKVKKEAPRSPGIPRTVDQCVNTVPVIMLSKAANTPKLSTATRATSTEKPALRHKAVDAIVIQVDKGVGDGDVKQADAVSNHSLMSMDSLESSDVTQEVALLSESLLSTASESSTASLPPDANTIDQSAAISEDINNNSDEILLLPAAEISPLGSPKFDECRFIDEDASDDEDLIPNVNTSGLGRRWGTVDLTPEETMTSPCGSLPIIVCSETPTTLKSIMKPRGSASSSDQSRLNRKAISFSQDVIFRERELEKSDDDVEDEGDMTVFENISLDSSIDLSTENKLELSTSVQTSTPTIVIELSADLAAACDMYALWLQDSTEVTSKQLNHSLKVIRHEWFTMTSQKLTDVVRIGQFLADMKAKSQDLLKNVVNMADDNGNSALHYAMSNSQFDVVRLLLETGVCDVSRQNKTGCTVIMLASLVRVETDEDRLVIQQLLKLGDINQQASLAGQTALMLAASRDRGDIVRMLLDAGADVNIQDDDGSTALMCAAEHGYIEVVKMLLAHPDCDPSLEDNEGSTAQSVAMDSGHREIGVLLYAHTNLSASGKRRFGKRKSPIPKPFKTN